MAIGWIFEIFCVVRLNTYVLFSHIFGAHAIHTFLEIAHSRVSEKGPTSTPNVQIKMIPHNEKQLNILEDSDLDFSRDVLPKKILRAHTLKYVSKTQMLKVLAHSLKISQNLNLKYCNHKSEMVEHVPYVCSLCVLSCPPPNEIALPP